MCINDFVFACAIDGSPAYFTYENETMLIINSEEDERRGASGFLNIEPFIEALISHETIHVLIKRMINHEVSDALDDLEVIVRHRGIAFQVTLNNIAFASDLSGIVLPSDFNV
ncbi:MAG: hypothetical protein QXN83_08525 [Nitrososphaerales archaeon]